MALIAITEQTVGTQSRGKKRNQIWNSALHVYRIVLTPVILNLSLHYRRTRGRKTKHQKLLPTGILTQKGSKFYFFQRKLITEKWDSLQYFQCIETTQYFHNSYSLFRLLITPGEVWWRGLQCVLGKSKTSRYFSKVTQMVPVGLTETWCSVPRVLFYL